MPSNSNGDSLKGKPVEFVLRTNGGEAFLQCRRCEVRPVLIEVENVSDRLLCEACRRIEPCGIALDLAGRHFSAQVGKAIQESRRRAFSGSKSVRYVPGSLPSHSVPTFIYI